MAEAYLGLGSNLGDRAGHLDEAIRRLAANPGVGVVQRSSFYETPPWGETDQPPFLNAALRLETSLVPVALLDLALSIERDRGRVRTRHWGPRTIDVDILAYGDLVLTGERLTLPHPHLFERAFVLVPLCEIAPDLIVSGRRIRKALAGLDRTGIVKVAR